MSEQPLAVPPMHQNPEGGILLWLQSEQVSKGWNSDPVYTLLEILPSYWVVVLQFCWGCPQFDILWKSSVAMDDFPIQTSVYSFALFDYGSTVDIPIIFQVYRTQRCPSKSPICLGSLTLIDDTPWSSCICTPCAGKDYPKAEGLSDSQFCFPHLPAGEEHRMFFFLIYYYY